MKAMSASTPSLTRVAGHAQGRVQDRAGGRTGEDPLHLHQLAHALHGVVGADREPGRQHRRVVQLRHEALVEVAQAVDQLAVARLGRDDLDVRPRLAQEAAGPHQGAGRAQPRDEVRDRRQVGEQLRTGRLVVGAGVGLVAVLVEHHPVGVLGSDLLRRADRLVAAARRRRVAMTSAPQASEQLGALGGRVLGHDADQPVAALLGHHRQRDAGVARGRLEQGRTGVEQPVLLGLLDHGQRRTVLDRAGRVAVLELRPQPDLGRGREPGQPDERGAAHRVEQRGEAHGSAAPPATAGRIVIESASATGVCSPSRKRTSSSLR